MSNLLIGSRVNFALSPVSGPLSETDLISAGCLRDSIDGQGDVEIEARLSGLQPDCRYLRKMLARWQ